jgi:hypothetical protein
LIHQQFMSLYFLPLMTEIRPIQASPMVFTTVSPSDWEM